MDNQRLRLRFVLAILVAIGVALWMLAPVPWMRQRDLTSFWLASRQVLEHTSTYTTTYHVNPYIYPPLLAIIVTAAPSYGVFWYAWGVLSIITFALSLLMIVEFVVPAYGAGRQGMLLLILGALHSVLIEHLFWGQMQIFLLFGMLLVWRLLKQQKQLASGVLLGFLAAIKIYPIFFALAMLRKGYKKAFAASIVSGFVCTVVGFTVVGWGELGAFLHYSSQVMHDAAQQGFYVDLSVASSLFGNGLMPLKYALLIGNGVKIAVIGSFLYVIARKKYTLDTIFALTMSFIVAVAPLVWTHYVVLLFFSLGYAFKTKTIPNNVLLWIYGVTFFTVLARTLNFRHFVPAFNLLHVLCSLTLIAMYCMQAWAIVYQNAAEKQPAAVLPGDLSTSV